MRGLEVKQVYFRNKKGQDRGLPLFERRVMAPDLGGVTDYHCIYGPETTGPCPGYEGERTDFKRFFKGCSLPARFSLHFLFFDLIIE